MCVHVCPCVCVCVRACVCVCVCVSVLCAELLALKDKIIQWMEQHTTEQIERERERNRDRERELEQFAGDQCLEIRRLRALLAQQEVMQPMTDVCASTVMRSRRSPPVTKPLEHTRIRPPSASGTKPQRNPLTSLTLPLPLPVLSSLLPPIFSLFSPLSSLLSEERTGESASARERKREREGGREGGTGRE